MKNARLNRRRPPNGLIQVTCQKGSLELGPNLALSLVNLSEDGACLLVREALAPGQDVSLRLEAPMSVCAAKCFGQVVWVRPMTTGAHCVGIRFDKRIAYIDLVHLTRVTD